MRSLQRSFRSIKSPLPRVIAFSLIWKPSSFSNFQNPKIINSQFPHSEFQYSNLTFQNVSFPKIS
jgi:hypothetical protein